MPSGTVSKSIRSILRFETPSRTITFWPAGRLRNVRREMVRPPWSPEIHIAPAGALGNDPKAIPAHGSLPPNQVPAGAGVGVGVGLGVGAGVRDGAGVGVGGGVGVAV